MFVLAGVGVEKVRARVEGWTWEKWEARVTRLPCVKFPNNKNIMLEEKKQTNNKAKQKLKSDFY